MQNITTDVEDRLNHAKEMAHFLRKRLRILEIQMAQRGMSTPPEVLIEIEALAEQIKRHEEESATLEIRAVEDELPLAEVEYRVLLAENWNTPQGRPNVVGAARLELARLRLGISPERARHLEQDIRAALAREIVSSIHDGFFTDYLQGFAHKMTNEFWVIGLAIRLNVAAAIKQFCALLPPTMKATTPPFAKMLLEVNQFWLYQPEYQTYFDTFVAALPPILRQSD